MALETNRRTFLSYAALSALAVVATGTLAGCGTQTKLTASAASTSVLPKFTAIKGVAADLPGTADGVPAAFFNYPAKPFRSVPSPFMNGKKVTAITNIFGPPPTAADSNPATQAIFKRLGGTVDITAVSSDDFDTKLNTVIAGGDLPDLMLNDGAAIADIIGFLQSSCQDLTPFLAGDKVKDYPNLANIPQAFWKPAVQNGKLYGIPIPRGMTGGSGFINQTFFEAAGVKDTSTIKSSDDYLALAKQLTGGNRWALGSTKFGLIPFHHIFHVPYNWTQKNGKLVKDIETPEYLEAISFVQKLYAAGCYAPGSEGWTKSQMSNAFISGQVAQIYDGLPAFGKPGGYQQTVPAANPANKVTPFIPFSATGGKASVWLDNIDFAWTMVKKGSADHIKLVLQVANFMAAPFGSEEYLLMNYGAADADYKLDGKGNPIPTPQAALDTATPWKYLAAGPNTLYSPQFPDAIKVLHDAYLKLVPLGVADPTQGMFSPTNAKQGLTIMKPVSDAVTNFIAGRGSLNDVRSAITNWKSAGGDAIRAEYQKALSGATPSPSPSA
ncbi:extracellular solute-binding protein [Microbacterium capsulatum]|uniref:Extracellular solute-binding protein n=1 Tax=Microbacterium capsulatum TaxID=3041921 RepID=A0ABU0XL10_9MICO|nr:extracellular solute-binding protein [Microbacterium sp. ASV81]MDQ4215832.1 extracellular solute-binding protein [Microbacterium sp. ASV81]